jgi:hypothetical protein
VWFLSEISNARLVMEQELEQGSEVHTAQPVISRRNRLFRYHAATTGVILLVAVILHSKHAVVLWVGGMRHDTAMPSVPIGLITLTEVYISCTSCNDVTFLHCLLGHYTISQMHVQVHVQKVTC